MCCCSLTHTHSVPLINLHALPVLLMCDTPSRRSLPAGPARDSGPHSGGRLSRNPLVSHRKRELMSHGAGASPRLFVSLHLSARLRRHPATRGDASSSASPRINKSTINTVRMCYYTGINELYKSMSGMKKQRVKSKVCTSVNISLLAVIVQH